MKKLTLNQAVKLAKKQFIKDHGKRAYKADISILPRYKAGTYIFIDAAGLRSKFYF
jgi:hypothetical protein